MEKRKVYLSGPITGNPNYLKLFTQHEKDLKAQGYEVLNPTKLDDPNNPPPWHECIIRDLGWVLSCEVMALLPGWHLSAGARIEVLFAIKMKKTFIVRPGAVSAMIFKLTTNHMEEANDMIPWGEEDELDTPDDEKGFLESGMDDIPGWQDETQD